MAKTRSQRRAAAAARPVVEAAPVTEMTAPSPVDEWSPRDVLADAWRDEHEAGKRLAAAVAAARAAGLSWHQVGLAVNMTAEGARRKWGALVGDQP